VEVPKGGPCRRAFDALGQRVSASRDLSLLCPGSVIAASVVYRQGFASAGGQRNRWRGIE
jgi:hypothetical protein